MPAHSAIQRALVARYGGTWSATPLNASGFCATWRAHGPSDTLFVKSLPLAQADVLDAEADGLQALRATATVRVPAMAGCWRAPEHGLAVLALEWLDLRPLGHDGGARLGQALAALHEAPPPVDAAHAGRFGWHRSNRIGTTPQLNAWSAEAGVGGWVEFHGTQRLAALRARLTAQGAEPELLHAVDGVIAALPHFFDDGHVPRPSLIHGDLWSGNWAALPDGTPVIFDPAVSCSDAEAELAMMELFGQPPPGLLPAYVERAGLHPGYARRRGLYQLYHLLNHALLFGGGYGDQALALAQALLRPAAA